MQVLFFDIGYTLINEDAVWDRRCREQAETVEAKHLGLSAEDIYHEIEMASIARLPQYRTVVNKFCLKEVVPYRHEFETLYEDVPHTLKNLSGKYELGVIANQADGLKKRLNDFGILPYFTYIVSSWDIQVMKPDVRIFKYALSLADCPPENAVMIGDRIDNDVVPAKSIGMKTVWVKQGFGRLQEPLSQSDIPDYGIEKLSELLKLF